MHLDACDEGDETRGLDTDWIGGSGNENATDIHGVAAGGENQLCCLPRLKATVCRDDGTLENDASD